ncbi:hypothetical protein ACJ73_09539 [Blastomyces percursus]|uniref:Methyltransferase domain-containing protein n=1 Tax=Blastomyces percursus TaxID=1658174 RepID=A0A1J9PU82_9EURO|nr:hypothetical protein ACJ73_09539 [Blastomyces percursus]
MDGSWMVQSPTVKKLCREAFEHLKPGGYFELKSIEHGFFSDDETHKKAIHALEWQQRIIKGRDKLGKPFCGATACAQRMENAGFVNIKIQKSKIPIGPWQEGNKLKQLGNFALLNILNGLEAFSFLVFTQGLQWSMNELQVCLARVRNDLKREELRIYRELYVIYGQKRKVKE